MPSEMTFFAVNGFSEATNRQRTFPRPDNLGIVPPPPNGTSIDFGHENNNLADNNNNKTFGGRVVYSLGSLELLPWPTPDSKREVNGITLGLSAMGGTYDLESELENRVLGVDMTFDYHGINFSGEYIDNLHQFKSPLMASSATIVSPTNLVEDSEEIQGYFVRLAYPIMRRPAWGRRLTATAGYDQVFRRGPQLSLLLNQTLGGTLFPSIGGFNPSLSRVSTRIDKLSAAFNFEWTEHFFLKWEYSYWVMGRSTTEEGSTDIYQGAFSAVVSF